MDSLVGSVLPSRSPRPDYSYAPRSIPAYAVYGNVNPGPDTNRSLAGWPTANPQLQKTPTPFGQYPSQQQPFIAVDPFNQGKASRFRPWRKDNAPQDVTQALSPHTYGPSQFPPQHPSVIQPIYAPQPRPQFVGATGPNQEPVVILPPWSRSRSHRARNSRERGRRSRFSRSPLSSRAYSRNRSSRSRSRSRSPRIPIVDPVVVVPPPQTIRSRSRSPSYQGRGRGRSPTPRPSTRSRSKSYSPNPPSSASIPIPTGVRSRFHSLQSRSRSRSPQRHDISQSSAHTPPPIASPESLSYHSSVRRSSHSRRSREQTSAEMAASEGLPARSPLTSSPHRSQISMAMPLQGITPGPIIEIRRSSSTSTYSNSLPHPVTTGRKSTYNSMLNTITTFALFFIFVIIDEIPRQTYSYFLLRIPTLYLSRVTRIFEEARLSLPDIKRMARTQAEKWDEKNPTPLLLIHQDYAVLPRSLLHFKSSWDSFIDSLMREWKTLNVISVLLMSAILTLLQIDAASHPITRTTALFSLICSLMSLLYGCIYIIRFGSMRKIHKAVSFGNDAQQNVGFLWNVWIMLAMPAIWLAWSIITFFASIMSFVWLTGSSHDPIDVVLSVRAALGLRIALSVVFGLGLLYFALIVKEFHRYGDPLDAAWQRAVQEWAREYEYPTRPPFVTLSQPYGRYKPPLRPNFTTPRSPDDSLSQYPLQREPSLIQTRSPTSSRRSRSPSRPPPTYIRQIDQLDQHELFEEVVAEHDKIAPELPAAFLRSFVVDEEPILLPPTTVMHLGRQEDSTHFNSHALKLTQAPLDISQTMHKEDWDRFVVDVSSAWKGDLTLVKAPGDQYSYRVVEPPPPPPRPTAPTPPSPAPKSPKTRVNWTRSLPASPDETISSQGPRKLAAVTEEDDPSTPTRLNASPATQKDDMISVSNSQSPTNIYMGGVSMLSDGPSRTRTLSSERPQAQVVQEFINLWNERYFFPRNLSVRLAPADRWAENAEFDVIMSHTWRHVQEEDMASRDPRPNMKSSSPVSGSEVGGGGSKLFRTADENDETLKQRSIP